jgi:hypothetical protein
MHLRTLRRAGGRAVSPDVIQVRADICRDCPTPCERQHDAAHHGDPCAACPLPRPRWGEWDCGTAQPTRAPAPGDSPWRRRLRGLVAAGMLVPAATRHARRDTCAACPHRVETGRRGLYGCSAPGARCGCVGGDEVRLALAATRCERWP